MGNTTASSPIMPIARPIAPATPAIAAIAPPQAPQPAGENVSARDDGRGNPDRTRGVASDAGRARGQILELIANLDAGRIALLTQDGPPYRGYVDTDVQAGAYWLKADPKAKRWVFESAQVKTGLRFTLWLDGPDPFTLDYADPLLLTVGRGLDNPGDTSLVALASMISQMIADSTAERHLEAVALLCRLAPPDLYDILDTLWASTPEVLNALLLRMVATFEGKTLEGLPQVIRAIESFATPLSQLYVDGFARCTISPDSFKLDEERRRAGLSSLQFVLEFDLLPARAVIVYADDITDQVEPMRELPRYGPANLTYPRFLTKGTTPRLHAAKKAAIAQVEAQNSEFIRAAFKGVSVVLLSVYQASASITKLYEVAAETALPRAPSGPGRWQATFEGGANMSEAAERYELTSCGTPRGLGYYLDNVQFEGFANGRLLDAKFWQAEGRVGGALLRQQNWAGWKVVSQAQRQLAVARAHGVGVEWRIADARVADIVRAIFRANDLAINVIHLAP